MADPEGDSSAQKQTSPPADLVDKTLGSLLDDTTKCESVPANVVEAVQSNDLVPALFALPCERGDHKKLKLCKRVGWLRDGVFTTGYMEINMKEAKQKGIFNQPRRVTLVRKEDSSFQSANVGTGSKTPSCDQLTIAMLKRKSSTTALVEVKGDLSANLILVGKDSILTAETQGKLVALNSASTTGTSGAAAAAGHAETSGLGSQPTGDTHGDGRVRKTPPKEQHKSHELSPESDKLISHSKNCDNNNTTSLSTDSVDRKQDSFPQNVATTPVKEGHEKLPSTEYFLTECGKASPIKGGSNIDSSLDSPVSPSQKLTHNAGADLKETDPKASCNSSSIEQHVPVNKTDLLTGPTVALNHRGGLPVSKELQDTATCTSDRVKHPSALSNSISLTINPNLDTSKRDVDFSSKDILHKEGMLSAGIKPINSGTSDEAASKSKVNKVNPGNFEVQVITTDKNFNPDSSESNETCLIGSGFTLDQPAVRSPITNVSPSSVAFSSTKSATSDIGDMSSPLTPADDDKRTFQVRTKDCPTQRNQRIVSEFSNSTTQQTPTITRSSGTLGHVGCQTPVTHSSMVQPLVSMNPGRTTGNTLSLSESENSSSDGFPALKIGSVYSLSEKEAKELFPEPRPPKLEKDIRIKQEPVDNYNYSNLLIPDNADDDEDPASGSKTSSAIPAKKEPIDTTEYLKETNIKSQFKLTSTATISHKHFNVKEFPFSKGSNVQLYNITPLTGTPVKRRVKRKICTPVAKVATTFQPNPTPSNVVQVPATGLSHTNVPPQVTAVPTKQIFQWFPGNIPANTTQPQLIPFRPVRLGSQQVTTGQASYTTPPSTLITSTSSQAAPTPLLGVPFAPTPLRCVPLKNIDAPALNAQSQGTKIGQAGYATRASTRSTLTSEKTPSVAMTTSTISSKSQTQNLPVASQSTALLSSQSQTLNQTVVSQSTTLPSSRSLTANLPVFSQSTSLPPSKSQTPTVLNLPVVPQSPGNKRIVITRVCREVSPGGRPAPEASVSLVGGARQTIPMPSSVISKMFTALNTSGSIVSSPGFATKPFPSTVSSAFDSHTVKKTGDSMVTVFGGNKASPAQSNTSKLELNPRKEYLKSPLLPGQRKTFLITTSNGEKRLVNLPSNADAAAVLSQMASNKAYQFVVPQNADEQKQQETKEKHKKMKEKELELKTQSPSQKKAKKSLHKHRPGLKAKKTLPVIKIRFKKEPDVEPESDVRRSARERKQKRPYSPPRGFPRSSKVARCDTPDAAVVETMPSPSPPDSRLPFIKTEPVSPEESCLDDDMLDVANSRLPQPPSPPSYVNRDDRVRRLKELMKEKEKALEEILKRRRQEMEERLADPELCDL